jgi:hypothetical protein
MLFRKRSVVPWARRIIVKVDPTQRTRYLRIPLMAPVMPMVSMES